MRIGIDLIILEDDVVQIWIFGNVDNGGILRSAQYCILTESEASIRV